MCMNQLIIKGGYGEHGRSCFLIPFGEDRYYMLDCGILDTDENLYPKVEGFILEKTDYLFLSHCHKDHSGAFSHLVSMGFKGWLVTSAATMELADIHYEKVIFAVPSEKKPVQLVQSEGKKGMAGTRKS